MQIKRRPSTSRRAIAADAYSKIPAGEKCQFFYSPEGLGELKVIIPPPSMYAQMKPLPYGKCNGARQWARRRKNRQVCLDYVSGEVWMYEA